MKKSHVFSMGFALFSMFFGSGNLVFPIVVGQESGGHYIMASLGILSTCVIFPLLGMWGIALYKGNIQAFFSCFGQRGAFLFSLLALALIGPFGVIARCLTVIHGALVPLFPDLTLSVTSLAMCLFIFFLAVNKNRLVSILGTALTPGLLISIAAITFFGLQHSSFPASAVKESGWSALKNGFFQGYQTMDLVAAFFFSGFLIEHLSSHTSHLKIFGKASLLAAGLLYLVYFVLIVLGWNYAPLLADVAPQEMLAKIAFEALGSMAAPCVCVLVILACITTAIALASLFADFMRKEIAQEKIGSKTALLITLALAFLVSNLEFAGIANFLGPILETMYPALITLTVVNIISKLWGFQSSHWPFTITLAAKLCWV